MSGDGESSAVEYVPSEVGLLRITRALRSTSATWFNTDHTCSSHEVKTEMGIEQESKIFNSRKLLVMSPLSRPDMSLDWSGRHPASSAFSVPWWLLLEALIRSRFEQVFAGVKTRLQPILVLGIDVQISVCVTLVVDRPRTVWIDKVQLY